MASILIVDDDELFSEMLVKMLLKLDHAVVHAPNGREALELYHPETIDLIITDLVMPDKEGVELIIDLRKRDPDVKIIAMSGGGRMTPGSYLHTALQLGASYALDKPFNLLQLKIAIETVLNPPKL